MATKKNKLQKKKVFLPHNALLIASLVFVLFLSTFLVKVPSSNPSTISKINADEPTKKPFPTITTHYADAKKVMRDLQIMATDPKTSFSNDAINIYFDYPQTLQAEKIDIKKQHEEFYKKYPEIQKPEYLSYFVTQFRNELGENHVNSNDDWPWVEANSMRITLTAYKNPKNISVEEFLQSIYKTYGGDGITETYETLFKSIHITNVPFEHSYTGEVIFGENPYKVYFFTNKDTVYQLSLIGGTGVGGKYSPAAEQVFTQIVVTIKGK